MAAVCSGASLPPSCIKNHDTHHATRLVALFRRLRVRKRALFDRSRKQKKSRALVDVRSLENAFDGKRHTFRVLTSGFRHLAGVRAFSICLPQPVSQYLAFFMQYVIRFLAPRASKLTCLTSTQRPTFSLVHSRARVSRVAIFSQRSLRARRLRRRQLAS